MSAPSNVFRKGLMSGRPQIGLWLGLADPYCAEVCADAGFDWLLIDGEHAPNDLRSILSQLQAVAPYASQPVVRPVVGDTHLIKQLLDIGAQTLLVPMVETAAQASSLVAAMHYPPKGIRGVGSALARASRWNGTPDYLTTSGQEMCLLVQIESLLGLQNLSAIAAVPGVDGVFIGPADLSAALGHLGNAGAPKVEAAMEVAIAAILKAGKAPGILMADRAKARRYIDLGCRFVAVGVDTTLLASAARRLAASFAKDQVDDPLGGDLGDAPSVY